METRTKKMRGSGAMFTAAALVVGLLVLSSDTVAAKEYSKQQQLIDKAEMTLEKFEADPNIGWSGSLGKDVKGILIIPQMLKGAFIFGGEGGTGAFLVRDKETGEWSQPAFYKVRSASVGLQIGGEASEIILLVMTTKGVESFYSPSVNLGADVSVAAGPVGAGAKGQTTITGSADMFAYGAAKGVFAGMSLEGAVVAPRNKWNAAYYGPDTRPTDILVKRTVSNSGASDLVAEVTKATK